MLVHVVVVHHVIHHLRGARAGEHVRFGVGQIFQRRRRGDDLERGAGRQGALQGPVPERVLAGVADLVGDVLGVVYRQADQRQHLAGLVVHHDHRAALALEIGGVAKNIDDLGAQPAVGGDGHIVAPAGFAVEKGGHALRQARFKAQQIVGLKRLHAVGDVPLVVAQQVHHAGAAQNVALIDALAVLIGGGDHHAPAVDDVTGDDAALGASVARVARAGDPAAAVGGHGIHPVHPGQRQQPNHHKGQHAKAQFLLFHLHLTPCPPRASWPPPAGYG